jgi:hypothetical protein
MESLEKSEDIDGEFELILTQNDEDIEQELLQK